LTICKKIYRVFSVTAGIDNSENELIPLNSAKEHNRISLICQETILFRHVAHSWKKQRQ